MTPTEAFLAEARRSFHAALIDSVLKVDRNNIPSNADRHSRPSVAIAQGILSRLGQESHGARLAGQMAGADFERICAKFVDKTFMSLVHIRPGTWYVGRGTEGGRLAIAQFDQYEHLSSLADIAKENPILSAALGSDYLIKPDIVIVRTPEEDEFINVGSLFVDENAGRLTSLRKLNGGKPILHASVSCKWTIRSDRAQNARSEGLNLVRNRKGKLPHIVVITGEPTPNRIASIALGTGDIDCVYHFALPELRDTLRELDYPDSEEMLDTMVDGKRLRDISDLPLDLVI